MKKSLLLLATVLLFASNAFASYWVVLKDGSRYECKAKPTVTNGKASFTTLGGQTFNVEASQIDVAKSEEATKYNGAQVFNIGGPAAGSGQPQQQGLGSQIKLRKLPANNTPPPPPAATTSAGAAPPAATGAGALSSEVLQKFDRAFENVGIFEHKVVSTGAHSLRADLTADSEEKVFNAISATAFLAVRDAGVPGVKIEMVELFMRTTNGGASGRFQMTREDATAIDSKQITKEDYFVRKVIY
jgi:hypothetical protein